MAPTPLPSFSWANGSEVWNCMLEKDQSYGRLRSEKILERHPSLVDTYRTILFDWLSEVSQECEFHRETYHLALDFIDRYLAVESNVNKYKLQLIGTTCLFLAAKYEEVRIPTVHEFADLTDGACRTEDIIETEVVILSAINWEITPMTPNSWLNVYIQILMNLDNNEEDYEELKHKQQETKLDSQQVSSTKNRLAATPIKRHRHIKQQDLCTPPKRTLIVADENSLSQPPIEFKLDSIRNDSFILPAQNGILRYQHKRVASVIDLALLHLESLRFTNSVLTASALYHFTSESTVRQCTGYSYQDLAECICWLEPFVDTIRAIREPVFSGPTEKHTHIANARLLDTVQARIEMRKLKTKAYILEEDDNLPSTTMMTPPSSAKKCRLKR